MRSAPGRAPRVRADGPEPLAGDRAARAIAAALRILLGLLWIGGASWKTPPDFGRDRGRGLYRFVQDGIDHEVFAPWAWVAKHVILPNFTFFGWMTLAVEASLGAFLLVGLATRLWAVIGLAQTTAIALSVLNTPHEWPWSYFLMFAAHLVVLGLAAGRVAGLDGVLRPVWRRSAGRVAAVLLRLS